MKLNELEKDSKAKEGAKALSRIKRSGYFLFRFCKLKTNLCEIVFEVLIIKKVEFSEIILVTGKAFPECNKIKVLKFSFSYLS